MGTNWTKEQSNAIYATGGTVLVSAAAGSGKTAVLVERVIQMITDEKRNISADRLLIATFSNAAASEMRQRIEKSLDKLINDNPRSSYLRRQKILLNSASISTVHSFCLQLVREHFNELDIMPDFRIGDESELKLMRNQSAEQVIEQYYESENPVFYDLVELISTSRDDKKLIQTILTLHSFIQSHPFPDDWLNEKLSMYDTNTPPQKSPWGKVILDYAVEALEHGKSICKDALNIICEDENMIKAYETPFLETVNILDHLLDIANNGLWDRFIINLQNTKLPKLGVLRGYNDSLEKKQVQSMKEYIKKKILDELKNNKFIASEQEYKEDLDLLKDKINILFDITKDFINQYQQNKKDRNLVDFSDLEHLTLSLLINKNDDLSVSKTSIAIDISNKYDCVLVDEYQDTNEVQDLIFQSVSKDETNLFMVGDVKQSIYAFRQAMPDIFISRRKNSVPYDGKNFPATIILDKNFRSQGSVCNGINTIFEKIMSEDVGGVNYCNNEQLVPGANYPYEDGANTNIIVVDASEKDNSTSSRAIEAREIGKRISQMIDSGFAVFDKETQSMRPCRYSDFCILLRAKTHTETYQRELESFDIPVWSDFSKNFFGSKEILFLLSFLSAIDNPLSDIDMCSAMMSPLFDFSPDDMARLTINNKSSIYISVVNEADAGDKKCIEFINIFNQLREFAVTSSVDELIQKIFELTHFDLKINVMSSGEYRVSNLNMLIKQAGEYESAGYRGLSGFIRFMKRLMEEKLDIPRSMTLPEAENVVKIMTIHRSKGLEFPVCFVADCGRQFYFNDLYNDTLIHSQLGFSCKYRNFETLLQYSTIPQEALKLELKRDSLSEEIRVLYVALTRAKEHLFIMCTLKKPQKTLMDIASSTSNKNTISPFLIRTAKGYSDWILMSVINLMESNSLRTTLGLPAIVGESKEFINIEYAKPMEKIEQNDKIDLCFNSTTDSDFFDKLEKRCSYEYPNIDQTIQPTKLAVSDIAHKQSSVFSNIILKRPKFLYKSGLSPAEKGNAHHVFMQFANYEKAKLDPKEEVSRMVAMGYLTSEEGHAIKINLLNNFFKGNIANRIFSSEKVMRELKFIIGINDNKDEHQTMIQGVADCVFFEGDEFVIVDYKTDYVKEKQELVDRYSSQLQIYKSALEQSLNSKAKQLVIYSFALNEEIII